MVEILRVREDYGYTFVRDMENGYLDSAELFSLIQRLKSTYDLMVSHGATQENIRDAAIEQAATALMTQVNVHYPFEHEFACWKGTGRNRSPKQPRFSGVYFVMCDGKPGQVKIGQSMDVYNRTKGLYHEYKQVMKLIAYIDTPDPVATETLLHRKFRPYQVQSEWFQHEPVELWLRQAAS